MLPRICSAPSRVINSGTQIGNKNAPNRQLKGAEPGMMICHDFATTRLALIRFIQRIRDFSSRESCFYAVKAHYALYVAVGPRLDTVGVWGSNPHAPTNQINNFREQFE